jgi:GNAT superfamily N-acetyltransferase
MTRLNEEEVDNTIEDMMDYYQKQGSKSFAWVIGPLTTPSNLAKYLKRKGFEHELTGWGMYLPMEKKIKVNELKDLTIKESKLEEIDKEEVQKMIETAYGMPEGSGKMMKKFMEFYQENSKASFFLAYDGKKPIGFGIVTIVPGTKGALMVGAATLQEYRGRGIYGNMLKKRKEKAKEYGAEYLIIQANEKTSAPIAQKHGFEKILT